MKKKVWKWSVLVLLLVILPAGAAEAKESKYELSVTKRTITEGRNYTIRLKKATTGSRQEKSRTTGSRQEKSRTAGSRQEKGRTASSR